jgi:aryl-phospho-beta-D-glucosidase BglC (GH1 family)
MIAPPLGDAPIPDPLGGRRGFTLSITGVQPDSYWDDLQKTGAKLARFWLPVVYDATKTNFVWGSSALTLMAHCVAKAGERGISLVVTIGPDQVNLKTGPIWSSATLQASYVGLWRYLAAYYAGNKVIGGFDICNEPFPPGSFRDGQSTWFAFAKSIRDAIREQDPTRTIILEPSPHGFPMVHDNFPPDPLEFPDLPPWAFDNVVWSYHMYEPIDFTHLNVPYKPPAQGQQFPSSPLVYPGMVPAANYPYGQLRYKADFNANTKFIQDVLAKLRAFQLRTRVPIYIGEFSAARWSSNASHRVWLSDVLAEFQKYGWAWTFHTFRGASPWDYEKDWSAAYTPDNASPPSDPARSPGWQTLLSALAS